MKIPDHLADSFKHSSVNGMAAGSGAVMEFFCSPFQTYFVKLI